MKVAWCVALCAIWTFAGFVIAGIWLRRVLDRYERFSVAAAKLQSDMHEKELAAHRSHINRLHRRLGMELVDEQGYLN